MKARETNEVRELTANELELVSGGWFFASYRQSETVASSVQKKLSDTDSAVIGKV